MNIAKLRAFLMGTIAASALATPVLAQESPPPSSSAPGTNAAGPVDDIVVTARRRSETTMAVPVAVSAIDSSTLAARGITNLDAIARVSPQLIVGASSGSFQGGEIVLRGITGGGANSFGDQGVAFVIDGVQVGRSTPRLLSTFDLAGVAVYKGPQALYYGKNSPGGIIKLDTADPGTDFEALLRLGYEVNARELRGEGAISFPITSDFGVRVAAFASDMDGWSKNTASTGFAMSRNGDRAPGTSERGGRLTLKFDNGDVTARLKVAHAFTKSLGTAANTQRIYCPVFPDPWAPQDDCKANNTTTNINLGTSFTQFDPIYGDGDTYLRVYNTLAGFNLDANLSDTLALSSTTGYYNAAIRGVDAITRNDGSAPEAVLPVVNWIDIGEFSQELRLTSNFDGPLNFMVGGYYQHQSLRNRASAQFGLTGALLGRTTPLVLFPAVDVRQKTDAISGFGSLTYELSPTLELTGGLRYSHEKKDYSARRRLNGTLPGGITYQAGDDVPTVVPTRSFSNVSPEATITYRPSPRLTIYGGWKRGFLSGGFNASGTGTGVALIPDRSYDQEIVQGFEGGLKALFLDNALRINLAAYTYDIKGLQVTSTSQQGLQVIGNAATARSSGAELDGSFKITPEFQLTGAIGYNDAHYTNYTTSPCYTGQTPAQGCDGQFLGGRFTTQNLTGRPLVRAPKWSGSAGASYEKKLSSGQTVSFDAGANYSSGFFADALNSPRSFQKGYWLLDASARFKPVDNVEIAFIGRNLTNKYYFTRSTDTPLNGGGTGTAAGVPASVNAYVSRGRELTLRATFTY